MRPKFSVRKHAHRVVFDNYVDARVHAGILQHEAGGSDKARIKVIERNYGERRKLWKWVRSYANELGFMVHRAFDVTLGQEHVMLIRLRGMRLIKKGTLGRVDEFDQA